MTVKKQLLERIDFVREYKEIGIRFSSETPSSAGWIPCYSIDRDEKKPSAAVNVRNGFYTDLGTGGRRLDFFSLMQIVGGYGSFREVLTKFASDYGISIPKGRPVSHPENTVTFQAWNSTADRWCEMKSTTREAVQMCGGEYCRYNGRYFCVGLKIFRSADQLDQVSGYVVAQTNGDPIPVLDRNRNQVSSCKIKTVAGSGSGLIGEHALLKVAEAREKGTLDELVLFKVEGVSDMLAFQARVPEEQRDRLLVLTNSAGCSEKPKVEWRSAFAGIKVVLIHDADQPGQKGLENWKTFLRDTAASVKIVQLPYEISPNHGKDLKDFFTEGHTFDDLMELVRTAEELSPEAMEEDDLQNLDRDHPERLARLFLRAKYAIAGEPDLFRLVYRAGVWFEYQDGCYQQTAESTVVTALTSFSMEVFRQDWEEDHEIWSFSGQGKPPKVRKLTNAIIANTVAILKALVFTCDERTRFWRKPDLPEWLDDQSFDKLIPVQNGILSLPRLIRELDKESRDWKLENYFFPPTPLFFTVNAFPVQFDPRAKSLDWCRMAERNLIDDPEDVTKLNLIQDFFGYCLLPESKLQKFLILTGEGRNGKSAVLMGFSTMIGDANVANVPLESFGDRFTMSAIQHRMVNVVDDLNETDKTCEGKLKSIVSGTAISTDRKNKDAISFRPYCRLIFACNALPRFQDTSDGIWRRMEVIPFRQTIPLEECRPELVTAEFWEKEKSGILNWCLAGLVRLYQRGWRLTESASTADEKTIYRYDVNPILAFFDENVEKCADSRIRCTQMYRAYVKWAEENGYRPKNSRNLGKDIRIRFPDVERRMVRELGKRNWVYEGLRLVGEFEDF